MRSSLRPSRWPTLTPDDSTPLVPKPDSIVTTTAGDVSIEDEDGNVYTRSYEADVEIPYRPHIVRATGTTATLRALYAD